jgi:serine/threonine-protein kinase/endoribonuclease IRE1
LALRFFNSRFPDLLMGVFVFAATHLAGDAHLGKYWPEGTVCLQPFCKRFQQLARATAAAAANGGVRGGGLQQRGAVAAKRQQGDLSRLSVAGSVSKLPPLPPVVSITAASPLTPGAGVPSSYAAALAERAGLAEPLAPAASSPPQSVALADRGAGSAASNGSLDNGSSSSSSMVAAGGPLVVVGYEPDDGETPLHWPPFPRRPGQQSCDFYVKTGTCKYAQDCCFDHPEEFAVPLTDLQLPFRASEPVCAFYLKTHQCKFGAACKFHHPRLRAIYAGSAAMAAVPVT